MSNIDKGKHISLFNPSDDDVFKMMTAVTDETNIVDFSKQKQQFSLDKMKIEEWRKEDLAEIEGSVKEQTERDKLAEESFQNVFSAVLNPDEDSFRTRKIKFDRTGERWDETTKQFYKEKRTVGEHILYSDVASYIKGDQDYETKLGIYKERLHDVWEATGKPSIQMSENPVNLKGQEMGKANYGGAWFIGGKRGYITPWKMTEPPPVEPFEWQSFLTQQDTSSLYDTYRKTYGELTDQDITYETSSQGRQDWMNINPEEAGLVGILMAELGHQMQGRHLAGPEEAQHFLELAGRQSRYEDHYADPRTIEYHAHEILQDIIIEYMKTGNKKILEKIKSGDYPNIKDTPGW
ncbi:hypothetical protein CMI47_21760 [Candidatus Pacearchaeota archaeon]|nr:hypothetical protein [Candidatus Pacearchaeota archaeon]